MRLPFIQRLKYYFKSFLYEDLSTLALHICRLYFLQNASRTAILLRNQYLLSETFHIWHKSSTKHKEVRPDWNDKTIMQTTRPCIAMLKVLPMAQLPFLKKYSIKCEKI